MSESKLSTDSLRSLFSFLLRHDSIATGLDFAATVRDRPIHLLVTAVGVLGASVVYKTVKKATALRAIDGPAAPSFMAGHLPLIYDPTTSISFHEKMLNNYGAVSKIKGTMGEDMLFIADPRAMYDIVVKGHDDFQEPEGYMSFYKVVAGPNITTATGHEHKLRRKILNPVFSTKHMRNLTPTITAIARRLESIISKRALVNGASSGIVDIYQCMNHASLEMVGQAGVGHSFGVMDGKKPKYIEAARDLFPLIFKMWYVRPVLSTLMKMGSGGLRRALLDLIPLGPAQELKHVSDVLDEVASGIYKRKKEALANGTLMDEAAAGNDIITLLLKQNETLSAEEQMTEGAIIADINSLIFAGHDTTSAALSRTLQLLAQHQDIQAKVRHEIQEAHQRFGKDLNYDQLNSLEYLDAVCRESLRLYPPGVMVERVAQRDWILPLHYPIKSSDGKTTITHIPVKKGTPIVLSILAANRDRQTWGDDANEFKPSRWLEDLPQSVKDSNIPGVYSSTMTFLGGPRACLGFKFSQLEMKVVLSSLIGSFGFELGQDDINWNVALVVKPHIRHQDGTIDAHPSLPMKVTVLE